MQKANDKELLREVSQRLVDLRTRRGLSQYKLARKLNLGGTTPEQWEMARAFPSIPSLIILSKVYHVSIDYILGVSDDDTEYISLD